MHASTMRHLLRTPTVLLVAVLAIILAVPGVALADQPQVSTVVVVEENQTNPCDPSETHDVTIVFTLKTHNHNNNVVRVIDAELSTDDGFVGGGHQTDVTVNDIRRIMVKHMMHHPETGERFSVTIRLWIDLETGEIIKGSGMPTFDCIRPA